MFFWFFLSTTFFPLLINAPFFMSTYTRAFIMVEKLHKMRKNIYTGQILKCSSNFPEFFYLLIKSVNSPNVFPPYFSREVLVRPKTCWSSFSKKIENLLSHSPSRFWDCCLIKRGVQLLLLPGINCFVLDSQLGLKKAWSKEVPLVPAFLMTATDRISKILFSYSIYIYFFFRWKQII